jgi:hypothetical protein
MNFRTKSRIAMAAVLLLTFGISFVHPGPTASADATTYVPAHAMTFAGEKFLSPCVAANSDTDWYYYTNLGPADKTWVIFVHVGLAGGGDRWQFAHAQFEVRDADPTYILRGVFRAGPGDWGIVPGYSFAGTITTHLGGNLDLRLWIRNWDASQCFQSVVNLYYI